jgi:hypothetical protein
MAPPGVRSLFVQSNSRPNVWVNGTEVLAIQIESNPERYADVKIQVWKIVFPEASMNSSSIALKIKQTAGSHRGAIVPESVHFECSKKISWEI